MKANSKIILVTLILTHFCVFCKGQTDNSNYTQILEIGLKGKVKQVVYYVCPAMYEEIPTDTTAFIVKSKMTFDKLGNVLEVDKLYNIDAAGSIKTHKMIFSGKGRDVSYKAISSFNNGKITEFTKKYLWSDNYTYAIISENNSTNSNLITLDKNYRLIKSVFKNNGLVNLTEELETIYENDKIKKIINKTTENKDGEIIIYHQMQVVKEYDKWGNPILLFMYDEMIENDLEQVIFKEYIYY